MFHLGQMWLSAIIAIFDIFFDKIFFSMMNDFLVKAKHSGLELKVREKKCLSYVTLSQSWCIAQESKIKMNPRSKFSIYIYVAVFSAD